MNRMRTIPFSPAYETFDEVPAEAGCYHAAEAEIASAIFAPLHYEPRYAYPLLIWLHGPGDDESQLKRIMPLVSMRNYVAAAPRGTVGSLAPCDGASDAVGFDWRQTEEGIDVATQRVLAAVAAARRRFHVAHNRVFLAGYESGGSMAFRLALRRPRDFAGVLSLGGPFPCGATPLRRINDARLLPLFFAYGRGSATCPTIDVCNALRLIHAAGIEIALRQYPKGDRLSSDMLRDMDRWMMERIRTLSHTKAD